MSELNQNNKKNKLILIILLIVFFLPPIVSWILFSFGDISGGKRNHGDLIQPPRSLENVELFDAYNDQSKPLFGKWSIVYLHNGPCNEKCSDNLYKMRQVRLATNKYAHRLQRILVLDKNNKEYYESAFTENYVGQLLLFKDNLSNEFLEKFRLGNEIEPARKGRLYIIDPLGNLMMSYESTADPIGIIEDLTLLIKISRIG